jgi:hypothetical protein
VDFRKQILAPCRTLDGALDLGAFLQHLLLFDTYIIKTSRLAEVPGLVAAFGLHSVSSALNSGALRIDYFPFSIGGQGSGAPMHFRFVTVKASSASEDLTRQIATAFSAMPSLTLYERETLESAIQGAVIHLPDTFGAASLRSFKSDIEGNTALVSRAIKYQFREHAGTEPDDFRMKVHRISDDVFHVETNLSLSDTEKHQVVLRGLLAASNLSVRLEQMQTFTAITGFRDPERPFLDDKLAFIMKVASDDMQRAQLCRVLELSGLPDLGTAAAGKAIDLERLLTIRSSRECIEFREWLRSLSDVSDVEVRQRVESLTAKFGQKLSGLAGRAVRFLTGAALAGPAAVAYGAIDSFVIDKVFARPGPVTFLSDRLPSIFKGD